MPAASEPTAPLCAVCDTHTGRLAYALGHYNVFRCPDCGLCYIDVPYIERDIQDMEYYWGEESFQSEAATLRRWADRELNRIEQFDKTGRLLDLGCSFGYLLEAAQRRGRDVAGVEISRKIVGKYLGQKAQTLNVFNGLLEDARYTDAAFDVVTMFDVIEHLAAPAATLHEVARILKPGGLLVIETPREESLFKFAAHFLYHITGGRSTALIRTAYNPHPGGHRLGFTRNSLEKLLTIKGFTVLRAEKRMMLLGMFLKESMRRKGSLAKKLLFSGTGLCLWLTAATLRMQNRMIVYAKKTGFPS